LRYEFERAFERLYTVTQAGDAEACPAARAHRTAIDGSRAAIAYNDDDRLCFGPDLDALADCFSMMKGVVQSFLHDPVEADGDRPGKVCGQIADLADDRRPRCFLMVSHRKPDNFVRRQSLEFGQYESGRDVAELG
jgi:hypothetical protein